MAVLVVLVAALLAGGAATLLTSVPDMAYAARWAGTPGVFVVRSCAEVGVGKGQHTECVGAFRSDDGRTVDPGAVVSQSLAVGAVVPVQRASGGGYAEVGVAAFCGWLAVTLFGVILAGTAVLTALAVTGRASTRLGWKGLAVAAGLALLSALVGAVAAAVS